jgi:multicomponent Na+:H+ antiporter subunit C
MTSATLAGLVGAALVGLGLYGLIANPQPLRQIVVAFSASALAVALVLRLFEAAAQATLNPDAWTKAPDDGGKAE